MTTINIDDVYKGALVAGAFIASTFGYSKLVDGRKPPFMHQAALVAASAVATNKLIEKGYVSGKFPKGA